MPTDDISTSPGTPARLMATPMPALAPALAGGPATTLWAYLTAPFLVAAFAVALYVVLGSPDPETGSWSS